MVEKLWSEEIFVEDKTDGLKKLHVPKSLISSRKK